MTFIFIDTEFTSLNDPRLISIGAVIRPSRQFYGICRDFTVGQCTPFVRDQVLPLLERRPAQVDASQQEVGAAFADWIVAQTEPSDAITIVADYDADLELARQLLRTCALQLNGREVFYQLVTGSQLQRRIDQCFEESGQWLRHNALDDAQALARVMTVIDPGFGERSCAP